MKKVLSITLANLILATLISPAYAIRFGGSVRGDVGMLGNQLPTFTVETGIAPTTRVDTVTYLSHRKEGQWDFTARLFMYTSCAPCATYIAASWEGSNQTVHSCFDVADDLDITQILVPLRILSQNNIFSTDILIGRETGNPTACKVAVKNKFSKAKLGVGFDLIKTCCFSFTMEAGGNYLDAQLDMNQDIIITQTVEQGPGCIFVPPGNLICSPGADGLAFDFLIHNDTCQKTEGVGIYTNIRAEYKFPPNCLGNCFSLYAKAEVADIIGRQKYSNRVCYLNEFLPGGDPIVPAEVFEYEEHLCNRYNNVVEVDLEAALVYSPCFRCWRNLNLNFALGARTDSFVNLFSKPSSFSDISYLSLTRPTVFLEIGLKV